MTGPRAKARRLLEAVLEVLSQYDGQLTVRQVYYRMVSDPYNLIENTRSSYVGFDIHLTRWRESGQVPWDRFVDRSRSTVGGEPVTWDDPAEYLTAVARGLNAKAYHLSRWADAQAVPEVWVEKDALASVIHDAVREFGVVIFPTRGYSSFTKLAEAVARLGPRHHIIYLSDHDPSGVQMGKDLERRLVGLGSTVRLERIGLTTEQVRRYRLAPNPVKHSDSRSPAYVDEFGDSCWELDALPPDVLRTLVRKTVARFVDRPMWDGVAAKEAEDRLVIEKALLAPRAAVLRAVPEGSD
jgi:hypothetical protein